MKLIIWFLLIILAILNANLGRGRQLATLHVHLLEGVDVHFDTLGNYSRELADLGRREIRRRAEAANWSFISNLYENSRENETIVVQS